MTKALFFVLLVGAAGLTKAEIKVSLLTSSPGQELHTFFGHSALRVVNTDDGSDKLYNHGLFDFKTPFFPIRLLKGDLEYWLGRQSVPKFIKLCNREKRTITEQVLNLSQVQSLEIFAQLEENAKSENKFYCYSFTKKNCSTEIRDILLKQGLIRSSDFESKTIRAEINDYLEGHYWIKFGMNLLLGSNVETKMSYEEHLFMPADLSKAVESTPDLVYESVQLNQKYSYSEGYFLKILFSPWVIFSFSTILMFFWSPIWLRISIYGIFGLLGCFVCYISFTTLHLELMGNFNLLWCNPLYIVLIPVVLMKRKPRPLIYLFLICHLLTLILWLTGVQTFDHQILPVMVLMGVLFFNELKFTEGSIQSQ